MNKEEICSSDYCVCMVCFKPVLKKSLGRHLSTAGHEWLNAHNDHSEFREVPEIADVETITTENFPYAALYFSKVFRIKEVDDCESITFLKWRCLLDSSVQGHASEVLEFPTKELLKVHVLKHLETYHHDFFNADFFQYERAVLQQELPNAADVYAYAPLSWSFDNEPFDTANPNHFDVPFRAKLLPRSCCDVQICGFCFWCGYSPQFLAHITCHGYVENGIELSDDPLTTFPVSLLTVDPESIDSEHFNIPNKILGKVGREVQRRLRGPYLALNNDGEIAKPLTIGEGGAEPRSPVCLKCKYFYIWI
ncbi:unnamed protein product [Heligmosomoides polygyrus]|uniref:C2H2-type domain-containing protein n=1 Tax=Heligmosomoides polygyrus TaxID=6339 RepID=A0A183GLY8_HELPZ|nr:unnamed protein product [Heligmosomoides polygyrus]